MEVRNAGIKKVLWQILVLNVLVAVGKAAWGLISGSTAMFADGIHSFTDGSGNIVALIAMVLLARRRKEPVPPPPSGAPAPGPVGPASTAPADAAADDADRRPHE